jgi:hypothetical protein
MPTLSVPLNAELIGELFLRRGHPKVDVASWIENVLSDYLDRTANDDWSEAYGSWRADTESTGDFAAEFGDPKGGYRWEPLFMPNGTLIRMSYKRQIHQATVRFDRIEFDGQSYTPSELASRIAAGTNRNAWRDLLIKRPNDADWCLADELRRRQWAQGVAPNTRTRQVKGRIDSGQTPTPLEDAMRRIAADRVEAAIRAKGRSRGEFSREEFDGLVSEVIERKRSEIEAAARQVMEAAAALTADDVTI